MTSVTQTLQLVAQSYSYYYLWDVQTEVQDTVILRLVCTTTSLGRIARLRIWKQNVKSLGQLDFTVLQESHEIQFTPGCSCPVQSHESPGGNKSFLLCRQSRQSPRSPGLGSNLPGPMLRIPGNTKMKQGPPLCSVQKKTYGEISTVLDILVLGF
jgi:hypothetical protein